MTLQIPHTFVAGTKAKALEMNENFTACEDAINANISDITTNASAVASLANVALKEDGSVASKKLQSYTTTTITNATNATPIVITSTSHGRATGDSVYINGVLGNTAANGTWTITVIDGNTFSLNNSVGNGAYTSGGTVYLLPLNPQNLTPKQYVDNKVSGYLPQNFIDGLILSSNNTLLTGTVTTTASSTAVVGSGASFTTQAPAGTILNINGVSCTVASVTDNTHLTLTANFPTAYSAVPYYLMTNVITTAVGVCSDSTNTVKMALSSAITKNLISNWVVGTGNGGLDTGSKAANTWYHVHLISTTTGTTDVLFSLSATAPALPSGYNYFRRIGSIKTDANGNIIQFYQNGDYFIWSTPKQDISMTSSTPTVLTGYVITAAPNSRAIFQATHFNNSSNPNTIRFFDCMENDTTVTQYNAHLVSNTYTQAQIELQKFINSASQLFIKSSAGYNTFLYVNTNGYIDKRGKN